MASRVLRYALSGPAGRTPDVHGPEILDLQDLARTWLRAQARRAPVISLPLPIQPFKAFVQLAPASGDHGGLPWQDWLSLGTGQICG